MQNRKQALKAYCPNVYTVRPSIFMSAYDRPFCWQLLIMMQYVCTYYVVLSTCYVMRIRPWPPKIYKASSLKRSSLKNLAESSTGSQYVISYIQDSHWFSLRHQTERGKNQRIQVEGFLCRVSLVWQYGLSSFQAGGYSSNQITTNPITIWQP